MAKFRITRIQRTDYVLDRLDVERLLAYDPGDADEYSDEQLARELLGCLPERYPEGEPPGVGEVLAEDYAGSAQEEDEYEVEHHYGEAGFQP